MKRHLLDGKTLVFLGVLAVLFLLPRSASAQTHVCDGPRPTQLSTVAGKTMTLRACLDGKDVNGVPLASVTAWTVYDNGVSTALTLTKGATTSTVSGKSEWSGPWIAPIIPGVHTMQVTATGTNAAGTAIESQKSAPFALTLTPAPAASTAPTGLVVE